MNFDSTGDRDLLDSVNVQTARVGAQDLIKTQNSKGVMNDLTIEELKTPLLARKLSVSGSKNELSIRLKTADPEIDKPISKLTAIEHSRLRSARS